MPLVVGACQAVLQVGAGVLVAYVKEETLLRCEAEGPQHLTIFRWQYLYCSSVCCNASSTTCVDFIEYVVHQGHEASILQPRHTQLAAPV